MVSLSEKAKGKQRAVETQEGDGSGAVPQRSLTIRFTDNVPDLILQLVPQESVKGLKIKIRQSRPQLTKRRLRLIYSGRILTDNVALYDWLSSLEKRQQKAVESQTSKSKEVTDTANADPAGSAPTWLHCSIGAEIEGEGDEDESKLQKSQIRPLRGFDRLAAAGFSEQDIANFRRTFHSQTVENYLDSEHYEDTDEDYDEHARALEEQWIDSLDDGAAATIAQSSVSMTLLQGLVIGFFFPIIPFFFLRDSRPAVFWGNGRQQEATASVIFSKRMQMALILGFIVNVTFGMWRYLLGG